MFGRKTAVCIGDSPADYGIARAAGVPVILVDFGYTHTPVTRLGADAIVSHLSEIPAAIRAIAGDECRDGWPMRAP